MINKILLATNNNGKKNELLAILGDSFSYLTLSDINDSSEVAETKDTFAGNSLLKAEYYYNKYHLPVIADDSGLEVLALDNRPSIYSKRYTGKGDLANNKRILEEMTGITNRQARFVCVITLYINKNEYYQFTGILNGEISHLMKGNNGFGYDPIFYLKDYDKCLAELDDSIKNKLSHRYQALMKMKEKLDEITNS